MSDDLHMCFRLADGTIARPGTPEWDSAAIEHRAELDAIHARAEALKLARGIVVSDSAGDSVIVAYSACLALARAVIAQAEELERLRRVAADLADGRTREHADASAARSIVVAQGKRIDELRAALTEALDSWQSWTDQEHSGTRYYELECARIAELRRLCK